MAEETRNRKETGAVRRRGKVIESLPSGIYRVELESGTRVLAHVTARRSKDFLRLLPGDVVEVDLSPLDPGRGRLVAKAPGKASGRGMATVEKD
jgi:translation initiation factor IF-1